MITTYLTTLQTESTPATTIEINPTTPDTAAHVQRLRQMPTTAIVPAIIITPVAEVRDKTAEDLATQNRYTCLASIEKISKDKPWFYVTCSACNRKMLKKTGAPGTYLCADEDEEPKF